MATVKFPNKDMRAILWGEEDEIVRDEIIGNGRWSIQHELIFKKDGKFYRTNYQVGATEFQDERPWEYEDLVSCEEVEPYEKITIDYRPIK